MRRFHDGKHENSLTSAQIYNRNKSSTNRKRCADTWYEDCNLPPQATRYLVEIQLPDSVRIHHTKKRLCPLLRGMRNNALPSIGTTAHSGASTRGERGLRTKTIQSLYRLPPWASLPNCLPLPELTRRLPINPLPIIWGPPQRLGESRWSDDLRSSEVAPLFMVWHLCIWFVYCFVSVLLPCLFKCWKCLYMIQYSICGGRTSALVCFFYLVSFWFSFYGFVVSFRFSGFRYLDCYITRLQSF